MPDKHRPVEVRFAYIRTGGCRAGGLSWVGGDGSIQDPETISGSTGVFGRRRKWALFALAGELDLDGIVGKHRFRPYLSGGDETPGLGMRNRAYSQMPGRNELVDRGAGRTAENSQGTAGQGACAGVR